jgi:RHS repeat-associated protein
MLRSKLSTRAAIVASLLFCTSQAHATAEICGNSIDDDGNGLTDDGCYPALTTGVCESPLSCGDTGMVSWTTGSLHYDLPPDVNPRVPYGPGIGFRRFYTSMYSPTGANPTTVNHTPLGPNWQHTYMTWLYKSPTGSTIVVHTSQGRDVNYTDTGACGSYECYTPQAGDHVLSLKYDATNNFYYLQLLTGETLKYNGFGQIIEIWDNLAPTPNKVLIAWTGTSNGNVSTVTDASGERRLLFSYTNNLLTSVQYQTYDFTKAQFATQQTTTYDYTNGVTRDATSQWFVPQSSTEWTNLLVGTGIPNPTNLWKVQETSGNLTDSIGTATLTASGLTSCRAYAQTVAGWSRKAVTLVDGGTCKWATSSTLCNPATTPCAVFVIGGLRATPSTTAGRDVFVMGDTNGARAYVAKGLSTPWYANELWNGAAGFYFPAIDTSMHPWVMSTIPAQSFTGLNFDGTAETGPWSSATTTGTFTLGSVGAGNLTAGDEPAAYLYAAAWNNASITSAQQQVLVDRIKNGPGLSQVSFGSGATSYVAQRYVYDSSGYLTMIKDGEPTPNQVVSFAYSSTVSGQLDLVSTSRGTVAFEYASTRTGCTGNTALYFNQGNTSSCSVDSDCGTGFMCGGKTGTGATGKCFLAARCLTTSSVNGESVITNVTALGPGGGSCSGACADVMQYMWTGTGTGNVNVAAREDGATNFTNIAYNSNGLPTQIGYGDNNSSQADGGANRTEYLFYDTTYPGRVAEVRRASELDVNASNCSATNTTGCQRTLYCYGSSCSASCAADNQLCTVEKAGTTLNSSGTNVTFSSKVTYVHDSKGRIIEIDGAVSGIKTLFDYYTPASNALTDYFLQDSKIYKDATTYLQPQITTYDFWGNPTSLKAPDGNYICDTYDAVRGYLASRRRAMAGQTSCTTPNAADLITSWKRDTWLRLSTFTRPDGSYLSYGYDSLGRLSTTYRLDAKESADYTVTTYTPDSLVSKIDVKNSAGTITATQAYTFFAGRQLQGIVNPADPTKFTGLIYDGGGKLTEIDGASGLAKTVEHFDGAPGRDGRVSSEERFKAGSASDTWNLLYAWTGEQSQVTDGDGKATGSSRDDLGRVVKVSSPDRTAPTVYVYDAASRKTSAVEVLGGGAYQQTHMFSYDNMGRPLNDEYQGVCQTTGAHPEIQRSYDALPTGVICPMTGGCNNLSGRLSYVVTTLMCSSTYSATDGALDQFTFYSYDAKGRTVEEYITDDSGRIADNKFAYTANGALSQVTTPSGAIINWVYGSSNPSDLDRVTSMSRGTPPGTNVIDSVKWYPFGSWQSYNWETSIGGSILSNSVDRNLAYRITNVHGAVRISTPPIENAKVAIAEDAMGRVTSRVYTPHDPTLTGLFDSYFTYDQQSRVVCESTSTGACPTSGSTLKNNHDQTDPFRAPGDWTEILRPIAGSSGGTINNFNTTGTTYGTSHQITDINQSNGTPAFGHTAMAYDARGLRSYDDNTSTLTNDRRDYTYDARRNVVNVRGQYKTGGAWHYYDVASAFDQRNRRVYKSFYDETTLKTATWFFYYDAVDRLTDIRYTPDISISGTYSVFQLFWLETKLVLYWQSDYVSNTLSATSKRYVASDETDRPIQLWNWPSTGDATRVWAINPSAWGADTFIVGATVFQPVVFAGQYRDVETAAYENDGATIHRQGLALNGYRSYDAFTGSYMQVDPLAADTWSSYVYADSNPVGKQDPTGRMINLRQFGTPYNAPLHPGCDPEDPYCGGVVTEPCLGGDCGDDPTDKCSWFDEVLCDNTWGYICPCDGGRPPADPEAYKHCNVEECANSTYDACVCYSCKKGCSLKCQKIDVNGHPGDDIQCMHACTAKKLNPSYSDVTCDQRCACANSNPWSIICITPTWSDCPVSRELTGGEPGRLEAE